MSILDLITDVIDEVHESETSLNYGDIPDRTIFQHIKSLWQLLLGIDESLYDSHNYELIELAFNLENKVFTGFTYLGSDFESISKNFKHSVGSPTESLKIVELLDADPTGNQPSDESVSFKLSMLNKIRFIVFRHHIMMNGLITDPLLEKLLVQYLNNDILNTANETFISFKSNNNILDNCYRTCFKSFILKDSNLSIEEISREILESFKDKAGVAFFFNSKIIINYHEQMIDFLKRIYRKHDFIDAEIDDYFKHNPILPILKPIYRELTLQPFESESVSPGRNFELKPTEEIDLNLLKQILLELSTNDLEKYIKEVPITFKKFPQIVEFYIQSLLDDGITDIENDSYISLVKSSILCWIHGDVSTELFIRRLCEISTIPTASPYTYKGIKFPNHNMRMALFMVKEDIRLYETYFEIWKNKTKKNATMSRLLENWDNNYIKKYYSIWKYQHQKVKILSCASLHSIETTTASLYCGIWRNKLSIIKENCEIADNFLEAKYLKKLKLKIKTRAALEITAILKFNKYLLSRTFQLWVSTKQNRFPDKIEQFNAVKKYLYFKILKASAQCQHRQNIKSHNFYLQLIKKRHYFAWKKKTDKPLAKLAKLDQLADRFIMLRKFLKWNHLIVLYGNEKKMQKYTNYSILSKSFQIWHNFKKLTDCENRLNQKLHFQICNDHFNKWKKLHKLMLFADGCYRKNRLSFSLRLWKLKSKSADVKNGIIANQSSCYFHIWRLKATENQFHRRQKFLILNESFVHWADRATDLDTRYGDSIVAHQNLRTATYFKFWRHSMNRLKWMSNKADQFKESRLEQKQMLMNTWVFSSIKYKITQHRLKNLELDRITRIHKERTIEKYLSKWKNQFQKIQNTFGQADFYQKILYETHYYDIWLAKFDNIIRLKSILLSKLDADNIDLLNRILSNMQLKIDKIYTDKSKAQRFKKRWDRLKTKTFFELWKLKKTNRTSPTPTVKANTQSNKEYSTSMIPDLNPYIDLAPRDRGSPEYRGSFRPQFTSVLNGQTSQFEISGSISEAQTPLTARTGIPSSTYRTPMMRRMATRSAKNATSRVSPDKNETNISESVKRARQRQIEERMSMYRLLRPFPSISQKKLSVVTESSNDMFEGGSIFDTPNESFLSSTPLKHHGVL